MSRFFKLALSYNGSPVPFKFIANDGNFVVNPITLTQLDEQGIAERYDIVVDFSAFPAGSRIHLVNLLRMRDDGRGPNEALPLGQALAGLPDDPVIGPMMEFRVVNATPSVDAAGRDPDAGQQLRAQRQEPGAGDADGADPDRRPGADAAHRVRTVGRRRFARSGDRAVHARLPGGHAVPLDRQDQRGGCALLQRQPHLAADPQARARSSIGRSSTAAAAGTTRSTCTSRKASPWTGATPPFRATERLVRKDVWRLRPSGQVTFQVQFGEYGGSYVNHCHNTVHEDFAMLMRYQLLSAAGPQVAVTPTPNPTPDGVFFTTPEILPEGDPRPPQSVTDAGGATGGG